MISHVTVRRGVDGVVKDGTAYTGGDCPAGVNAAVRVDGDLIVVNCGTIVRVSDALPGDVVDELLTQGFAVQLHFSQEPPGG